MKSHPVPHSLKVWFVVHFIVDVAFAIPLFLFPQTFLDFLQWRVIDPFTTRLVAAALFGIGIESLLGRNAGAESFRNMLTLKIIWSAAATAGLLLSIVQGDHVTLPAEWLLLLTFFAFHLLWIYYRVRIGGITAA
jgi:hypothetical protein